jgi:hypothetical protein
MKIFTTLWLAMAFFGFGCESAETTEPQKWCGVAGVGFEESSFRVCDSNERWWVESGPIAGAGCGSGKIAACYRYACVTGTVSPTREPPYPGYGHLGSYARELTVTEVLEVRELKAGECPTAP